jgi:hypothetical protein
MRQPRLLQFGVGARAWLMKYYRLLGLGFKTGGCSGSDQHQGEDVSVGGGKGWTGDVARARACRGGAAAAVRAKVRVPATALALNQGSRSGSGARVQARAQARAQAWVGRVEGGRAATEGGGEDSARARVRAPADARRRAPPPLRRRRRAACRARPPARSLLLVAHARAPPRPPPPPQVSSVSTGLARLLQVHAQRNGCFGRRLPQSGSRAALPSPSSPHSA